MCMYSWNLTPDRAGEVGFMFKAFTFRGGKIDGYCVPGLEFDVNGWAVEPVRQRWSGDLTFALAPEDYPVGYHGFFSEDRANHWAVCCGGAHKVQYCGVVAVGVVKTLPEAESNNWPKPDGLIVRTFRLLED